MFTSKGAYLYTGADWPRSSVGQRVAGGHLASFQGRSPTLAFCTYVSLLQAIDCVRPLSLRLQAVSQAPQHLRSSEAQFKPLVIVVFSRQTTYSAVSLASSCDIEWDRSVRVNVATCCLVLGQECEGGYRHTLSRSGSGV